MLIFLIISAFALYGLAHVIARKDKEKVDAIFGLIVLWIVCFGFAAVIGWCGLLFTGEGGGHYFTELNAGIFNWYSDQKDAADKTWFLWLLAFPIAALLQIMSFWIQAFTTSFTWTWFIPNLVALLTWMKYVQIFNYIGDFNNPNAKRIVSTGIDIFDRDPLYNKQSKLADHFKKEPEQPKISYQIVDEKDLGDSPLTDEEITKRLDIITSRINYLTRDMDL